MHIHFQENLQIKGHLTISKIANGEEELVYDEDNVIVSGFGWGLAHMYAGLGSLSITDFQIDRFQLGVSGHTGAQVSSTFQLSGPLSSVVEYTTNGDSNIYAFSANQVKNGAKVLTNNFVFASIPFSKVTKINDRSVRYTMFLDEDSANNIQRSGTAAPLNEIGLFMKNPLSGSPEAPVLVAYRYFSNITKTSSFGLVFRWTITFG